MRIKITIRDNFGEFLRAKDINLLFRGYDVKKATSITLDFKGIPPLKEQFFIDLFSKLGEFKKEGSLIFKTKSERPIKIKNLYNGKDLIEKAISKVFGR